MLDIIHKFGKGMIIALILMMTLVLFLAVVELGYIIGKDIIDEPILMLDIDDLLEIFGMFLLVLIGIELLDSIKAYISENIIHVEVVLIVAIIAIARKVIILDIDKYPALTFVGIAGVILALAIAYFLIKRVNWECKKIIKIPKSDTIL